MYLSSTQHGDVGRSGRAGRETREAMLRRFYGGAPVLSTNQVHSMRIAKLVKLSSSAYDVFLLEATWNGAEYVPAPSHHLYRVEGYDSNSSSTVIEELNWKLMQLNADGILCNDPDVALSVTVADCMPIFAHRGQWRALLHSGWSGTGILRRLLEDGAFAPRTNTDNLPNGAGRQTKAGRQGDALNVVFGPCISADKYEVDPARAELFAARFGQAALRGHCLDLRSANCALLAHRTDIRILVWEDCTFTHPEMFSYRQSGPDTYSRMLALFPARPRA